MEGGSLLLSCLYQKTNLSINLNHLSQPPFCSAFLGEFRFIPTLQQKASSSITKGNKQHRLKSWHALSVSNLGSLTATSTTTPLREVADPNGNGREMMPKIDKSGRFCSPRAARELALLIVYAACLEGCDPIRLFEKRMNARKEPGYEFDNASLLAYNHMSFGGPPVTAETTQEADELESIIAKESSLEAEILSAPPKLVYSKLLLRFTRKLLVAVVERWDSHVLIIDRFAPPKWKNQPAARILELCILHLAMSEITALETRHQIVINEAVDLAKRFCDGAAPRVINGCLGSFVKGLRETQYN
ncbi:NusB domain-containing protein [Cephalotus follicularis]|uniref:NusB domain-containing protein n=1 Tax=Cephalotus follicularis TaxID=3775 RepID=A0A1Q3AS60_CEPFO|nr:NusB domain-containing protein [Cephalotus follicularis]